MNEMTSRSVAEFTGKLDKVSGVLSKRMGRISIDLSNQIGGVSGDLTKELNILHTKVKTTIGKMENSVTSGINEVSCKINSSLNKADVVEQLNAVRLSVKGIQNYLKTGLEIPDYSDHLRQIEDEIEELTSFTDSIGSTASSIYEKIGVYSSDSIDYQLNNLERLVREAIDAADRARQAIEYRD